MKYEFLYRRSASLEAIMCFEVPRIRVIT